MLHKYVNIYLLPKSAILLGQSLFIYCQHHLMVSITSLSLPRSVSDKLIASQATIDISLI